MPRGAPVKWYSKKQNLYAILGAFALLTVFIILSCYAFGSQLSASPTVQLACIIFRHGDRTPTQFYPNDPYKSPSFWPDGLGALTKEGKKQMYKLGQYLRKRYNGFLSPKYLADDAYIFSSDHDRCLMSAQACLAGLYPPVGDQIWNKDINWQPIPVHTIPRNLDKLIVVKKPCPKYDEELNHTYHSEFFENINVANNNLYDYLTDHSGMKVNSITNVESLYNTLEVEEKHNLKLPDWAKKYFIKMRELATLSLASFTFTDTTKRLKGGPLLAEVVEHMSQKVLGLLNPPRKIYLYSSHDLTLMSVLRALGIESIEKPEYGATIIFELHQEFKEGDHLVKLWYLNNTEQVNPISLKIPKCEEMCKLKDFVKVTKPLIPEDWEKECYGS